MKISYSGVICILNIAFLMPTTAYAIDDMQWRGFVNANASYTNTEDKYLDRIDEDGDFSDTSLGLNMLAKITDQWIFQGQIFSHDQGDGTIADWFFGKYKFGDSNTFTVGKIKYSGSLLSSYIDVGYAYPWVRAPQEIYGHNELETPMFFETFKGLQVDKRLGDSKNHMIRLLGGEAEEEGNSNENMFGVVYRYTNDNLELVASYNISSIDQSGGDHHGEEEEEHGEEEEHAEEAGDHELDEDIDLNGKNYELFSIGAIYTVGNFKTHLEYIYSQTEDYDLDTDAGYVAFSYQFDKLTPHLTLARIKRSSDNKDHSSVTFGLRYEFSKNIAFKLEYQNMDVDDAIFFEEIPEDTDIDVISAAVHFTF